MNEEQIRSNLGLNSPKEREYLARKMWAERASKTTVADGISTMNRQTGRTTNMLVRALAFVSENPSASVLIVGHSTMMAKILKARFLEYAEKLHVTTSNVGFVAAVPKARFFVDKEFWDHVAEGDL